jgi:hypothetical protein
VAAVQAADGAVDRQVEVEDAAVAIGHERTARLVDGAVAGQEEIALDETGVRLQGRAEAG